MDVSDGLALAAFVLSVLLGAWELVKYRHEGGRIRVTLQPGRFDPDCLTAYNSRAARKIEDKSTHVRFDVEAAIIMVENLGRMPLTVMNVGLDCGRAALTGRSNRRVSFAFLKFEDCATSRRVRLEPADSATFLLDASHALPAIWKEAIFPLRIRATAQVAGRRLTRSTRRTAWDFAQNQPPTIWRDEPYDLARQIYRFWFWRVRDSDLVDRYALPDISMDIAELVERGEEATEAAIQEVVNRRMSSYSPGQNGLTYTLLALELSEALASPSGGMFDVQGHETMREARGTRSRPMVERGGLPRLTPEVTAPTSTAPDN